MLYALSDDVQARPSSSGGRWPEGPDEGSSETTFLYPSPHPALRATLSRGERASQLLTFLVLLCLVLLAGCSAKKEDKEEKQEAGHVVTVDVAPVLSSSISLKITADALLYPLQQAAVVPKISAPVKKFYVDRGSQVRAGQLLAELENRDLAATTAENQAVLEQAEANYQTIARGTLPEDIQ